MSHVQRRTKSQFTNCTDKISFHHNYVRLVSHRYRKQWPGLLKFVTFQCNMKLTASQMFSGKDYRLMVYNQPNIGLLKRKSVVSMCVGYTGIWCALVSCTAWSWVGSRIVLNQESQRGNTVRSRVWYHAGVLGDLPLTISCWIVI